MKTFTIVILISGAVPVWADPDFFADNDFISPGISLSGTEVTTDGVRLRIVPDNWIQTTKNDFGGWGNKENVISTDSGDVKLVSLGNGWIRVTDTTSGTYGEAAIGTGENIYIAKGANFYRYKPAENSWVALASPPKPDGGSFKTGTALAWDGGNYIYAMLGAATNDARRWFCRYDISSNSWKALENTPADQGEGDALAWVGLDNQIYATIGGEQRPTHFAKYDSLTNSWGNEISDPPAGMGDGASLVWAGDIYLYALRGEFYENVPVYDFWRYDLLNDEWNQMESIPAYPHGGGVGGVGDGGSLLYVGSWLPNQADFIYALSGNQAHPEYPKPIPDNRFFRYTISTNSWERLADLPFGIGDFVGNRLAYADEHIYAWQGSPDTWAGGGDELFRYEFPTYPKSGYFTSAVFDAQKDSTWQQISWDVSEPSGVSTKEEFVSAEPEKLIDGKSRLGLLPPLQVLLNSSFEFGDPPSSWNLVYLGDENAGGTWERDTNYSVDGSTSGRLKYVCGGLGPKGCAAEQTSRAFGTVNQNTINILKYYARYQYHRNKDDADQRMAIVEVEFTSDNTTYKLRYYHSNAGTPADNATVKYVDGGYPAWQTWTSERVYNLNESIQEKFGLTTFIIKAIRVGVLMNKTAEANTTIHVLFDNVRLIKKNPSEGYASVQNKDGIYENVSEENTSSIRTWTQNDWSGGATGTPPVTVAKTTKHYCRGENENTDKDVSLAGFFWENRADIPGYGSGTSSALAENGGIYHIYALRGGSRDFYRYSIPSDNWESMAQTPVAVGSGASLVYAENSGIKYLYAFGGDSTTEFWRYRIYDDCWENMAPAPATVTTGGGLVWTGADNLYATRGGTTEFWRYSISTDTWDNTGLDALPGATGTGTALCWNGRDDIYVTKGGASKTFYRYSFSKNTWSYAAPAPATFGAGGSLAHVANYIYAVRGAGNSDFWRYNISTDSWEILPSLPKTVGTNSGQRLVYHDNHLYMIRGVSTTAFWRFNLYQRSAYLESSILDAGENVVWSNVKFESEIPAGTSLVVKFRTGTDNNPYLQDGSSDLENWSSWQTSNSNETPLYENRYLQYRVELSTKNSNLTPVLKELSVWYSTFKYALRWGYRIGVEGTLENVVFRIYGYNATSDEDVGTYLWNDSVGAWVFIGNLSNSPSWIENRLDDFREYAVGDTLHVKFEDEHTDTIQTTICLDYVGLEAKKPYSTSIKIWTSSSADGIVWSDWIEHENGDDLPWENRYLQYRAQFLTTDDEVTPVLHEIVVYYVPKIPRVGTFTSQPIKLGYVENLGPLSWDAILPENTSITLATRSSKNGSTWLDWQEVRENTIESPTYGMRYLQLRATFFGYGILTPTLRSYRIDYVPDRSPPEVTLIAPEENFTTTSSYVQLRGVLKDPNPSILVANGNVVCETVGNFSSQIELRPGYNTIRLMALDEGGNCRWLELHGTRISQARHFQEIEIFAEDRAKMLKFVGGMGIFVVAGVALFLYKRIRRESRGKLTVFAL